MKILKMDIKVETQKAQNQRHFSFGHNSTYNGFYEFKTSVVIMKLHISPKTISNFQ